MLQTVYLHLPKEPFFSDVESGKAHVLVNTVESITSKYTVKQYADAHNAWLILNTIGHPSTNDYITCMQKNQILNRPIMKANVLHAQDILGPNLGSLKGKQQGKRPKGW